MRLPRRPLDGNLAGLQWLDPPGTLRWLGARLGVGDACSDAQQAANAAAQNAKNLKGQMVDLDAAIMAAAINNQDTTDLENQKKQLQQAINAALGNAAAAVGKVAILCAAKGTAETCPDGYVKDASGKCVPAGGPTAPGCTTGSDCAPGQICVGGTCVDCPGTQVRNAQGVCAEPAAPTSGGSNWGLIGLAVAAVGGIFIASRGQLKELGAGKGNQYRGNPRRKRRRSRRRR